MAGYLLLSTAPSGWREVAKLAVHPSRQRQGAGAALLGAALRHCAAAPGCEGLRLHVDPDRPAAVALYARAGFLVTARRDDYYRLGRAALRMELPRHGAAAGATELAAPPRGARGGAEGPPAAAAAAGVRRSPRAPPARDAPRHVP